MLELRERRLAAGLSLEDLADLVAKSGVEISISHLSLVERGKRQASPEISGAVETALRKLEEERAADAMARDLGHAVIDLVVSRVGVQL